MGNLMTANLDFAKIRADFPALATKNRGKPWIYLDSASSAHKPQCVIDAVTNFYAHDYANVHRGIYEISERATEMYNNARDAVRQFINAKFAEEIVFVRNATEAINLVAFSWGRSMLKPQDEIILSEMEHHSNIVPWYMLAKQTGANLKIIPISDIGELDLAAYQQLFSARTKLVAITHASNVLGTINPLPTIIEIAHAHGALVLVDGAQAAPHLTIDVQKLDCDFYVFSGHKLYSTTGTGVLYARQNILQAMPPYQGGGNMIAAVSFDEITYAAAPERFEAGTPNIGGVIGLHAAINYLRRIDLSAIYLHEQQLLTYAQAQLATIPGLRIIGQAQSKLGVIAFVIDGIHPHDIGTVLDHEGIAVRAGHHCAQPLMQRFRVPAMVRASLAIYNRQEEIDLLIAGLKLTLRMFG